MGPSFPQSLEQLAAVCQVFAGDMLSWVDPPDPECLATPLKSVPSPSMEVEAIAMERLLVSLAAQVSISVHRNFFNRFNVPNRGFVDPPLWPVRNQDHELLTAPSIARWAVDYRTRFRAQHDTPAQRTRRELDASAGQAGSVHQLAAAVALTRRTLERQFRHEMGVSIARYGIGLRLEAAVKRLRSSDECIEAVALSSGWRTKKGLYDALASVGLTPKSTRELPVAHVSDRVASLKSRGDMD